ncbi:MAG: CRTAC1 family protein [Saprospiraceae bacterium]
MKSFKIAINRFKYVLLAIFLLSTLSLLLCSYDTIHLLQTKNNNSNKAMIDRLNQIHQSNIVPQNLFSPQAQLAFYDSIITTTHNKVEYLTACNYRANVMLNLGREEEAIKQFTDVANKLENPIITNTGVVRNIGLSFMRLGERQNCVNYHNTESCIFPIQSTGIHYQKDPSKHAIEIFEEILKFNPEDYESRWLLNIAYMTIGEYPSNVPKSMLIPDLNRESSSLPAKAFMDIAPDLGLNLHNMAGGLIIDDFNNDHYMDIVCSEWGETSTMHYFINDQKGRFIDMSKESGLGDLPGGLNMIHSDYDNDGDNDILVLRGAWKNNFGEFPNSLLRNNGDNTFTDVTHESGIYSENPTQAAVWRDFNNDGWLDLFIGNETSLDKGTHPHYTELFINMKNGKFEEVAAKAGCRWTDFIKGVTAGDYDQDGLEDLFISSLNGNTKLLRNTRIDHGIPQFTDVTRQAGLFDPKQVTFPTWFWDYDNDGWLDLFMCGYNFGESIASSSASEALRIPNNATTMYLYRNNHDGTFSNVTKAANLSKNVFGMGSNFGDFDNDGYPDMYIGTGNPLFSSLVPNKLFRNNGKGGFDDVTVSARVGNLQKGHGTAFCDLDNDGDQDIFIVMGGAYPGDAFYNSFYLNPGQNDNHWINVHLEGAQTNKSAIGARLKFSFKENGITRNVYKQVNSGGSFGDGPFRRETGIGTASMIDQLEIIWPLTGKIQRFNNIKSDQFIHIKENEQNYSIIPIDKTVFPINYAKRNTMCKQNG